MSEPTRRPRVAILGTRGYPSYYGGFETAVRRLAPALVDAGWDVLVYGRPGTTRPDDADLDTRVIRVETRGLETQSLSTLSYGASSAFHALRARPDVALVMNVANGFWLPFLRARGIPTLVNVDGIEWERAKWGRAARTMFRTGAWLTARVADGLVADAVAIGDRWRRDHGVDSTFIPYGAEDPGVLPFDEPGLAPGGYALVVARFVPENTIDEFVTAAATIARRHDVVIVGSSGYGGPVEDRVRSLAASNPRVHWLGHIDDDRRLFALWQNAGAYFHGHSVGGTNPALVQAMTLGAPTVARDTVYTREVLADTAVFVEPEPAAIANAVTELLDDPDRGRRLGAAARDRAAEHYTWDLVCDRYERSLRALLRR
jgi:glycosyltransferase involved in cell wall biosynthesis